MANIKLDKTKLGWWKSAVFYQIYPKSFCDSNGDGVYADELVASDYTPHDGYVTFSSATFSPFTLVYDETSVFKQDLP